MKTCDECKLDYVRLRGRGLCGSCYDKQPDIMAKQRQRKARRYASDPAVREQRRRYNRKYYLRYMDQLKEKQLEWRKRREYGISLSDYRQILSNPCAICGKTAEALDHNHRTGVIRSALCFKCNSGLGMFCDSVDLLLAAAEYLLHHDSPQQTTLPDPIVVVREEPGQSA